MGSNAQFIVTQKCVGYSPTLAKMLGLAVKIALDVGLF